MLAAGDASKETNTDARYPHCILEVTQEKKMPVCNKSKKRARGGESSAVSCAELGSPDIGSVRLHPVF